MNNMISPRGSMMTTMTEAMEAASNLGTTSTTTGSSAREEEENSVKEEEARTLEEGEWIKASEEAEVSSMTEVAVEVAEATTAEEVTKETMLEEEATTTTTTEKQASRTGTWEWEEVVTLWETTEEGALMEASEEEEDSILREGASKDKEAATVAEEVLKGTEEDSEDLATLEVAMKMMVAKEQGASEVEATLAPEMTSIKATDHLGMTSTTGETEEVNLGEEVKGHSTTSTLK